MAPESGASALAGDLITEMVLRRLVERYAHAADRRDAAGVTALFAPHGRFLTPEVPSLGSRQRTLLVHRDFGSAMGTYVRTTHAIVGFVVHEIAEGRASATTSCIAHHVRQAGDALTSSVWGFRYLDRFVGDDARWLFDERALQVDWIEDRPVASARSDSGWL